MKEESLHLFTEELPVTDPQNAKPEKVSINNLQENLLWLMNQKGCSLAEVQKETSIPFPTLYGWYKGDVKAQLLEINIKELADYFDVTIDELAFGDMQNEKISI